MSRWQRVKDWWQCYIRYKHVEGPVTKVPLRTFGVDMEGWHLGSRCQRCRKWMLVEGLDPAEPSSSFETDPD